MTLTGRAPLFFNPMAKFLRPDSPSLTTAACRTSAVARYGANGILDPTFSGDGITQIDFGSCCQSAYSVLLHPDGTIVALGFHPTASNRFAEFAAVRYLGSAGSFSLSLP